MVQDAHCSTFTGARAPHAIPGGDASAVRTRLLPARAFVILTLLLLLPPTARAERLPARLFTTADGLANNVVNRTVRDSRGYQWFCTREGLSMFDGSRFVSYGTPDGLPLGEVNDILETRAGSYWVGTSRGLVRFDPMGERRDGIAEDRGSARERRPMFEVVLPADASTPAVTVLLQAAAGQVWVGTLEGLYRLESEPAGSLYRVDLGAPIEVLSLASTSDGALWIGTSAGLYLLQSSGRVERYTTNEGLPGMFVTSLLKDDKGRLWVGTHRGGVAVMSPDPRDGRLEVWRTFAEADGLPSAWVNAIAQTSDGAFWFATRGGVARMRQDPATCRRPSCAEAVTAGFTLAATALAEDRRRNVWVGTVDGAAQLLTGGVVVFSGNEGIPAASSLLESSAGMVLAMTAGATVDGAAWFDGERFVPLRLPFTQTEASWGWDGAWLCGRDGEWWIGTRTGALRLRGVDDVKHLERARERRLFSPADGLAASVVLRLFQDSRGDVWIATVGEGRLNGLSRWERATDTLHHYRPQPGLPDLLRHFVTAFAEDRSGAVWLGFSGGGGLSRIRGSRIERFSVDHLPGMGTVRGLLRSADGTLWGATSRGGLLRVANPSGDNPTLARLTTAEGLSSNVIGAIVEDTRGRIFAGTARGIDRIVPATQQIVSYSTLASMPSGEVSTAMRDRHGRLWFGHLSGIVRFTPIDEPPPSVPFVLIDALSVDGRPRRVSAVGQADLGRVELAPGGTALHVSYLAPGFGMVDHVRYQVKLEGADQDWSRPSEQRIVHYARIGPGSYRFAVRAVTAEGVLSSNLAGFDLLVLAPVWQRWWFLASAFALCGAAGYAVYRRRIARLVHVAEMRARIARDLHDDIGANLTRIAVLAEVARRHAAVVPTADAPLGSIANVARQSMTSMGDIVWAVNPEWDSIETLTQRMREYAEEVFAADDVALSFSIPAALAGLRLGPDVRRDLYLAFKEATNNAARHSGCSRFSVELRRTRRFLTMTIADDGRGFAAAGRAGNGLPNMRRRVASIGGRFELQSSPDNGTSVVFEIPLVSRTRLFG